MRRIAVLVFSAVAIAADAPSSVILSAQRFAPGVVWQKESVLIADFTCRGRREYAVVGSSKGEILVAVFANGITRRPELLHYSAAVRSATEVRLKVESLDFNPSELTAGIGEMPEGLEPSKTCKGLNLDDDHSDSAHIYWNRVAQRFDDWSL